MHSFRDKYFAWPGDMTNATSFWGASSGCPATAGTGTQTCNGNGDNVISAAPAANQYGEFFTFWQHLANAGLIEGSYTGRAGSGGQGNAATTNVPASKLSSAYWFIFNWNQMRTGATDSFDGPFFDNMFQIGGLSAAGTAWTPRLKPEEAWNIDMKLDDGRPAYGIMRERYWDDCTDAATSATLSASYALTVTGTVCTPIFILK
jgi:hypothetical protein